MGICFGSCNEAREREFAWRFDGWFISQTECGDGEVSNAILTTIDPELARRLRETNEEFELLAQKEQDGTLTVREREDYLSHSWRVPTPRTSRMYGLLPSTQLQPPDAWSDFAQALGGAAVTPERYQKEPDDRLIRSCGKARFNLSNGEPLSYCEGYVHFEIARYPRSSRSWRWSSMKHEFYATLVANGEIERFIDTMRGASRKDYELRQAAKEEVLALPASGVLSTDIDRLSQRTYIRIKCDPA